MSAGVPATSRHIHIQNDTLDRQVLGEIVAELVVFELDPVRRHSLGCFVILNIG